MIEKIKELLACFVIILPFVIFLYGVVFNDIPSLIISSMIILILFLDDRFALVQQRLDDLEELMEEEEEMNISDNDPWKCDLCGKINLADHQYCQRRYEFGRPCLGQKPKPYTDKVYTSSGTAPVGKLDSDDE